MLRLLLAFLVFCGCVLSKENEELTTAKIFVHPANFATSFRPPSPIKPTTAAVVHYPGVPPGWPTKGPTPAPPTRRTTIRRTTRRPHSATEATQEPFVLNPGYNNQTTVPEAPNRQTFLEWLMGIVGLNNNNNEENGTQTPAQNCPKCPCGLTFKNKRIVGGVETYKNQYPWMTYLKYNNRFYCGASLINNKYVLTAAHCVNGFAKERLSAVFLDHDRSNQFDTQTITRSISRVFRHRSYGSGGSYNNDIAILQLSKELPITGLLKPVCLPPKGKSFTGHKGIAVGWGATQVHGQVSSTLREVEVPIMSNKDCGQTGYGSKITENMICAGYPQGMKDSCQGDSGGPLHVVNGTIHSIAGIVSWGEGCAMPNYPGVYTRVNRYVTWIRANTKDACYCEDRTEVKL